jgi:predicted PurR-regulated permease PerM
MEPKALPGRALTWFVVRSVVTVLYFARVFLAPIALAVFVAFVPAPLAGHLTRTGMPRVVSTALTMAGVGLLVTGFGWMLTIQVQDFADELPDYRANLRSKVADVRTNLGSRVVEATATVRELGEDLVSSATDSREPAPKPTARPDTAWKLRPAFPRRSVRCPGSPRSRGSCSCSRA